MKVSRCKFLAEKCQKRKAIANSLSRLVSTAGDVNNSILTPSIEPPRVSLVAYKPHRHFRPALYRISHYLRKFAK